MYDPVNITCSHLSTQSAYPCQHDTLAPVNMTRLPLSTWHACPVNMTQLLLSTWHTCPCQHGTVVPVNMARLPLSKRHFWPCQHDTRAPVNMTRLPLSTRQSRPCQHDMLVHINATCLPLTALLFPLTTKSYRMDHNMHYNLPLLLSALSFDLLAIKPKYKQMSQRGNPPHYTTYFIQCVINFSTSLLLLQ